MLGSITGILASRNAVDTAHQVPVLITNSPNTFFSNNTNESPPEVSATPNALFGQNVESVTSEIGATPNALYGIDVQTINMPSASAGSISLTDELSVDLLEELGEVLLAENSAQTQGGNLMIGPTNNAFTGMSVESIVLGISSGANSLVGTSVATVEFEMFIGTSVNAEDGSTLMSEADQMLILEA